MDELLCRFISQHSSIALGELGVLHKKKYPAVIDNANNAILPPAETLVLQPNKGKVVEHAFVEFVAASSGISISDADKKINTYLAGIMSKLYEEGEIIIRGLGTLQRRKRLVKFTSVNLAVGSALPARKVLRENAVHSMRVGEKEVLNIEMKAFLEQPAKQNLNWMYWSIATLLVVLLTFMYLYYQ